jgi:hypothetical protein
MRVLTQLSVIPSCTNTAFQLACVAHPKSLDTQHLIRQLYPEQLIDGGLAGVVSRSEAHGVSYPGLERRADGGIHGGFAEVCLAPYQCMIDWGFSFVLWSMQASS